MRGFSPFAARGRLPLVRQAEAAECGLACLAMVLAYHGCEPGLAALRRSHPVSLQGTSARALLRLAERLGMSGRGLRVEPDQLRLVRTPAILHWDMNHFVVLKEVRGRRVTVHDPAAGVRRLDLAEVGRHLTGVVLELAPAAGFEHRRDPSRLGLADLVGRVDGMGRALAQALVLSVVLQLLVLAGPFYLQLAVDEVAATGDGGLLAALALGFGLVTCFRLLAEWMRAQVLLRLGALLGHRMVANLFHHFVRLPLEWFEKRHVGDFVSRFGSTRPIRELVAEGLAAGAVDGLTALLTLAMLAAYSPLLAGIVLAALAAGVLVRLLFLAPLRQREEEAIAAAAREQSTFIETARAIQTIKVFGHELEREGTWQDRHADLATRTVRLGSLRTGLRTAVDAVGGLETLLVVYAGTRLVMDGTLTVGMLFAFMSYKQLFLDKASRLLDTALQYRMLGLHVDRIADIALAPREPPPAAAPPVSPPLAGAIALRSVAFRYGEADRPVLDGVDLQIGAGEFVAITGPSGGGKTTLLKVMLGLFRPTAGEVLVDGRPLDHLGAAAFRAQVGVVMQEDCLLAGSLLENISFFAAVPDIDHARRCAAAAGIDDDIMSMPMNYGTPVGDMGMALSGGQRQRVLLARALYRRPRMLFMDEGTSHLDPARERQVNESLAGLGITRVVIAHRAETIAAADRVLVLSGGRLRERPEERARVP